jgi:hypothetical protein
MIVYDLCCGAGHRFEGWFGSSDEFARQQGRGLVICPHCGSPEVAKAPMAPAVPRKGNQMTVREREPEAAPVAGGAPPPEVAQALQKLAEIQAEALKSSKWVGDKFAEESRAIHYGEREAETIHGKATPKEAKALLEEGIKVAPLPLPIAPPDELN